jgi:hypothetical protein
VKKEETQKYRLGFKHPYSKLDQQKFYTIRRYDRYKIGQELDVYINNQLGGSAVVIGKLKLPLQWISTAFLLYDTDKTNRADAIALINTFYRKPISAEEILTIINCRWYWWDSAIVRGVQQSVPVS